jgi:hypothetical protein
MDTPRDLLFCLLEGAVPADAFRLHHASVNSLSLARGSSKYARQSGTKACDLEGWRKMLVRIEMSAREVDISGVSAVIDTHWRFALGCTSGDDQRCSYISRQAARLHHRCRLIAPPDAARKSLGSQIRCLWISAGARSVRPSSRIRFSW